MKKENILLLHGALGSKAQFQELKKLLSSEYNVLDLNFDGHGDCPLDKPFSIDLFVSNILAELKVKNIVKTHIFGYSMGGYVGLKLAIKHSGLVDKIFTLGTKFNWNKETAQKEVGKLNPELIEEKLPSFAQHLNELHSGNNWKTVLNKTADLMKGLGDGKKLDNNDLKKIKHKVIVGIGKLDKMVSQEESKQTAEILPNGSLLLLEGVKHPVESIDMKQLAEIIVNQIREN